MPWQEVSILDQRREFVRLAMQEGVNRRELCRRFGIHPDTGYKWLARWAAKEELTDRARRPHSSPSRTEATIEERVLAWRDAHPAWGARKLAWLMGFEPVILCGCPLVPGNYAGHRPGMIMTRAETMEPYLREIAADVDWHEGAFSMSGATREILGEPK